MLIDSLLLVSILTLSRENLRLLNYGSKETLILLWSWKVKSMLVLLNSNLPLKGIIYLSDEIEMRWEVMIFVREDIPVKQICSDVALNIEGIFIEINLGDIAIQKPISTPF